MLPKMKVGLFSMEYEQKTHEKNLKGLMSVQGNMREDLVPAVLDGPDCAAHPRLARLGLGSGSACSEQI